MTMLSRYIYTTLLLTLFLFSLSCAQGRYLKTRIESTIDNRISYTILFHDAGFPKQIVILDIEGDDYDFDLPGAAPDAVVSRNVSADKVLAEGLRLIGNPRIVMRKILGEDNNVIGYELRPLHSMLRYGSSDLLNVDYVLSDRKVTVTVEIRSSARDIYIREFYGGS